MDLQEAYIIVQKASDSYKGTGEDHRLIQKALTTIAAVLFKDKLPKKVEKENKKSPE